MKILNGYERSKDDEMCETNSYAEALILNYNKLFDL